MDDTAPIEAPDRKAPPWLLPHVRSAANEWAALNAIRHFDRPPMGGIAMPVALSFSCLLASARGEDDARLMRYAEEIYLREERHDRNVRQQNATPRKR